MLAQSWHLKPPAAQLQHKAVNATLDNHKLLFGMSNPSSPARALLNLPAEHDGDSSAGWQGGAAEGVHFGGAELADGKRTRTAPASQSQPPFHVPTPLTFQRDGVDAQRSSINAFTGRRARATGELLEQRNCPLAWVTQMSEVTGLTGGEEAACFARL